MLDTDLLAHDLMSAGASVFEKVVEKFGRSILDANGEIDRAVLGRIVFSDSVARENLNELVHPAVIKAAEDWKTKQTCDVAVLVPLLFETGWTNGWSAIVCISANEKQIFQRLEKRGLSEDEARKRVAAQMPLIEKENQSDFIIRNNETLNALREETFRILKCIRSQGKDYE